LAGTPPHPPLLPPSRLYYRHHYRIPHTCPYRRKTSLPLCSMAPTGQVLPLPPSLPPSLLASLFSHILHLSLSPLHRHHGLACILVDGRIYPSHLQETYEGGQGSRVGLWVVRKGREGGREGGMGGGRVLDLIVTYSTGDMHSDLAKHSPSKAFTYRSQCICVSIPLVPPSLPLPSSLPPSPVVCRACCAT